MPARFEKHTQFNIWYLVLALFGIMLFQQWWHTSREVEVIPYSQFEQLLQEQRIEEIQVRDRYLEGRLKQPLGDGRERFVTTRVEPGLSEHLRKYTVKFTGVVESNLLREILSWVLPVLFFFALWMFLYRRFAERQGLGGLMSIGKSKAKVYVEQDTGVTFDDDAGVDEARAGRGTAGVRGDMADDLDKATDIARNRVTRFGRYEQLGQMTYEEPRSTFLGDAGLSLAPRQYSEETAREIDCAIRELTAQAREKALRILRANRAILEDGTRRLLEKETLLAEELPRPEPWTPGQ
jgi:ATP-dependent Zn protease